MKTYFGSPERASGNELLKEIQTIAKNPVVNGLMDVVGGLFAILNKHRQIVALNETLLEILGIGDARKVLGLRLGEAIHCIHAHEMPGGCGTSEFCSTCGAAIAIIASLDQGQPTRKNCAVRVTKKGKEEDLYLQVCSCPMVIGQERLVLLFIQDITNQQKWAALERMFFHDIKNITQSLLGATELSELAPEKGKQNMTQMIKHLLLRLVRELAMQNSLAKMEMRSYQPLLYQVSLSQVFKELEKEFSRHPAAKNKSLILPKKFTDMSFKTDFSLLMRILNNMVINALEATEEGRAIKVTCKRAPDAITFSVWNKKYIPNNIAKRIFQRNFSTKQEAGRGLGTYIMKLFGEELLNGKVDFTTSKTDGTVFRFSLKI
jgi:K+-sensing histidine kinase KdpD